jgi:hypothetical protein
MLWTTNWECNFRIEVGLVCHSMAVYSHWHRVPWCFFLIQPGSEPYPDNKMGKFLEWFLCALPTRRGEEGVSANYRGQAVRKGVRCLTMLPMSLSFSVESLSLDCTNQLLRTKRRSLCNWVSVFEVQREDFWPVRPCWGAQRSVFSRPGPAVPRPCLRDRWR